MSTPGSTQSSPPAANLSFSGAAAARLVNEFSPTYAGPFQRVDHFATSYVDPKLQEALLEEHRLNIRHHLCCDRVMKEYLLEAKKFEAIDKRT